jgi:uncharacterized protein YjdB
VDGLRATGVAKGSVTVTAFIKVGSTTVTGGTTLAVNEVALKSLALTPAAPKLAKGTTVQLTATGTFEDQSTQDLTGTVTWTSESPTIASVSDDAATKGLVSALETGTAKITAKLGDVTASATTTITNAALIEIAVTSPHSFVAKGTQEQFTAAGIFSDDSIQDLTKQVTWASSDPSVTISDADATKGLATAVTEGTATISATLLGVTGTRVFMVTTATLSTIEVTPTSATLAKGTVMAFVATGIFSDHTFQDLTSSATWSSSDEAVAKVANDGVGTRGFVTAVAAGTVEITAKYGQISGSTAVVVTGASLQKVDIVPLNPLVPKGLRQWFQAIGTFSDGTAQNLTASATWGTSDATVANVSNVAGLRGMTTTLKEGAAVITASIGAMSASTTLTVSAASLTGISVTPANPALAKGTSLELTATGIYSDETTQNLTALVTWTSSDPAIVAVSNAEGFHGHATGLATGNATVTAKFDGVSGSTLVTVSTATLATIAVTPTNPTLAKGTRIAFLATGTYTDGTTQDLTAWATWSSSDASVSVSNDAGSHGLGIGLVQGSAVVTATYGGKSGSTTVTVTAATLVSLEMTPQAPAIAKGTNVHFTLVGVYTDDSKQDLTSAAVWASSNTQVAAIYNVQSWFGVAFGISEGTATITANYEGKSASTLLTVSAAKLVDVTITPDKASIAKGTTLWLTATAKYTDNTTQDITSGVTWASSDPTRVIISNAIGSQGLATAVAEGTVTISAVFGGKTATTSLAVTAASLTSIQVVPAEATMNMGTTLQFAAVGTYSDNSTQVVTTSVTWASTNTAYAIASNAYGSRGLVTAVAAGTTMITATMPGTGKSGSAQLTVK